MQRCLSDQLSNRLWALMLLAISSAAFGQIKAPGFKVEQLVKPSAFHGVHGLTFDADGKLYAGSVVGQSVYRVDTATGKTEIIVGPPDGMADDLVFMPDGTLVWTSINQNVVRARKGNGPIKVIADNMPGANSINVRKSDGRLFMGQVFAGDGLWELDHTGAKPPRNILKNIGGLNGFDFGPDGWIYGPLWFKKQVVKINPDTGELKVVAGGFHTPAAANFDSKWNLYVLDTALGTVNQVDIKTGAKKVVAKLDTSLDNLAIDQKDRLFVSNMADNGIQEVNVQNGRPRQVIKGSLAIPLALAAVAEGKHDLIYVADIFAFRAVDSNTGRVIDIERSHADGTHIEYPVGVSANAQHMLTVLSTGEVLQFNRRDNKFVKEWKDAKASSAVELNDGTVIILQGKDLVRIGANNEMKKIAGDLGTLQGLAVSGNDAYVVDLGGGQILNVNLVTGAKRVVAKGLDKPMSVALKEGQLLVVEFGKQRLVSIHPSSGAITELANKLPIGLYGRSVPGLGIGLSVGATGAIYVTSDIENSIYKLTKE